MDSTQGSPYYMCLKVLANYLGIGEVEYGRRFFPNPLNNATAIASFVKVPVTLRDMRSKEILPPTGSICTVLQVYNSFLPVSERAFLGTFIIYTLPPDKANRVRREHEELMRYYTREKEYELGKSMDYYWRKLTILERTYIISATNVFAITIGLAPVAITFNRDDVILRIEYEDEVNNIHAWTVPNIMQLLVPGDYEESSGSYDWAGDWNDYNF